MDVSETAGMAPSCCTNETRLALLGDSDVSAQEREHRARVLEKLSYLCLPVYFNAWENEHWLEPLPALAVAIADAGDTEFSAKEHDAEFPWAKALDGLLSLVSKGVVTGVTDAVKGGADLVEDYRKHMRLRDAVGQLVDAVLRERANRMVLVIDELDRCDPEYALNLLKQVRSVFTSHQITILYAVNLDQLSRAVRGRYGADFSGSECLDRFFDVRFELPAWDVKGFLEVAAPHFVSSQIVERCPEYAPVLEFHMSLRQAGLYLRELGRKKGELFGGVSGSLDVRQFMKNTVAPLLIALKHCDPTGFMGLAQQERSDALCAAVGRSPRVLGELNTLLQRLHGTTEEYTAEQCLDYLAALIDCVMRVTTDESSFNARCKELDPDNDLPFVAEGIRGIILE